MSTVAHAPPVDGTGEHLASAFRRAHQASLAICEPLEVEDYLVQGMPDVSPTKWPLAHTSWFFEEVVLKAHRPGICSGRHAAVVRRRLGMNRIGVSTLSGLSTVARRARRMQRQDHLQPAGAARR
jgi:hypothetical protein